MCADLAGRCGLRSRLDACIPFENTSESQRTAALLSKNVCVCMLKYLCVCVSLCSSMCLCALCACVHQCACVNLKFNCRLTVQLYFTYAISEKIERAMNLGIHWAVKDPAGGPYKSRKRRPAFLGRIWKSLRNGTAAVTQAVFKCSL